VIAVLVIVAVVVVLGLGFYFTRGARGPAPFDAEGRMVDAGAHAGPLGKPMPFPEGAPEHEPASGSDYVAETETPSEDVWAREEARYRAKNEGENRA
jgi:hypothetical protein